MKPESKENLNNEELPEIAEIKDIESLKQALAEAKEKAEDYLASWQRTQADFINYKRRNEQDREEFNKFANTTLVLCLLPVLDDLERALAAMPPKSAKLPWVEGIRLIERKFRATLENQGLTQIKALGEPFDPNLHEAVRQGKGKEGIIIEELQKGYKFRDRVIRPNMVVVGNGEEAEKEDR
ncbi:nucleotide exchange factor GrpE [Chloroflexota bacterium]